jgi:hypothetical protein
MPDPKKKPIVVNSKNDPRYRAYQDSLRAYNTSIRDKNESLDYAKRQLVILNNDRSLLDRAFKDKITLVKKESDYNIQTYPGGIKPLKSYIYESSDGKNAIGAYDVLKKPQQPVIVQDVRKPNTTIGNQVKEQGNKGMVLNQVFEPKDTPQVTPLQQIQTKGLIESNQQINTPLATIRPQAQIPKSWNIDYSAQRMNGGKGYYDQNNQVGVDLETALRAKEQADRINAGIQKKYGNSTHPNAIERLNTIKDTATITPQYAYGGQLNNNMQNNNLTRFDEGGLHHQNPLGGVPIGGNNTVEEGETKMKNYVYSNRLSIDENMTKEMSLPSYIKGKTFASASKAIDNKFKDRNDKYSNETKNTLLERLKQAQETLKQQEQERAEQIAQSMQSNQQQVPDMMNGQIPEGMEEYTEPQDNPQEESQEPRQFFNGGNLNLGEVANLTGGFSGIAGKASPYIGAATGALKLGDLAQGNGASPDKATSALNGAATGAQAGMMFGPWGAGIGAAVGIGAGLFGANKANKAHLKNLNNQALAQNRQFQDNNFAYGGNLKKYDNGGYTTSGNPLIIPNEGMSNIDERYPSIVTFKPTNTIPQIGALNLKKTQQLFPKPPLADDLIKPTTKEEIQAYQLSKGIAKPGQKGYGNFGPKTTAQFELDKKNWTPEIPDTSMLKPTEKTFIEPSNIQSEMEQYYQNKLKNELVDKPSSVFSRTTNTIGDYLDNNGGKFLKYAPVAMNAYQLAKLKKPVNQRLQRLDDKYKAQYVDEAALQNVANQEMTNTINGISQSGASQGAIRSSILGAGLNKTKALSDAYMKADAENRLTDDKAQQFNLGVNQFNTQVQHKESENWERNEANYRNEKSKYLASIGTDLGQIGKEEVNKNQIAEALGYSVNGDYVVNKKTGEKMLTKDFDKKVKDGTIDKNYNFKDNSFIPSNISYKPSNFKLGK